MYRILILISFISFSAAAQDQLLKIIMLDEVEIFQDKDSFSVEDFIFYVKNDTTFYKGFKHLRYYPHFYKSELKIFDKKKNMIANLDRSGTHFVKNNRAWVEDEFTSFSGKVYTNKIMRMMRKNTDTSSSVYAQINKFKGKYKYYTPEAFDKVFFPYDGLSVSIDIGSDNASEDKDVRDAKTIGFSIGTSDTEQSKGGVSKKLAIFDESMQKYYNYRIGLTNYKGTDCYTFSCIVKESLSEKELGKTLIRKIISYFDKDNFNVLYREYVFSYRHLLIDLDMQVIVYFGYENGITVPKNIYYKGFWNVPFYKAERAEFNLELTDYQIP